MTPLQLSNLLLDQSKDLFWIINLDFQLIYANKRYLNLMKEMTGVEKKLNESVFDEGFGEGIIEKWKAYYNRALKGEHFEIEEHFYHPGSNKIQYTQATFEPLTGEDDKIFAVACQSKDITRIVKERSEANQLMDASLDVFCTINQQGNFVYVSAAALNQWGYSPQELIGKPFQDLILEEDVPTSIEIEAAILSGREIKSFNNRYKKQDGGIAYNSWSARWDDNTKLMYAVARDYSDKIEEEEKIQQSEQRFKALVREGSDLIEILDAEYNYIYVSPTSTSFLGMAPEEFIGRNRFEFIHPDDVERTLANLQKIATEKRVIIEPVRFQNHKKEWRWVETVLTNMLDNPAVKGIVANSRDITDKIEEKHKLKLLESVITNTKDAVLITEAEPFDQPGPRILYVNEAFTKMTGYSAAEVIGKTPRILQGPNSDKVELARLSRAIRNGESCEISTINYKKNGEEFWINFTLTPVADEKGYYTHWISIERDVTEQKIKELGNELLAQISVNFNAENDYSSAANEVCKSIGKFGKFDWVEVWTVNLEKNQLQLFSHYVAAPEDENFYDYSRGVNTIKMSESLAGKVWYQREQILFSDIENNNDFIRSDAAKKIGLKAIMGIPLIFNNEVVGVLKIGTKHSGNFLKKYNPIFKQLEGFIGSELNRKKLENDLSYLFDAIPDIICIFDFKGRFLKINRAGCELLGYSEGEILYHSFEEFLYPADKDITYNEAQTFDQQETTFGFENRYLTKTGDIIWLSWNRNTSIEEGLIYATAKNITEEKKLRELNRQVGSLAKIGSWEMDLTNQKIFWSDEIHQLHETDPKSFVPTLENVINFYREDFRQMVRSNFEKCLITREPYDFEAVIVTAKMKELWVRGTGNSEFVDDVCKRVYGSFQDINDRKESENRLLALAENIPGVIYQYIIHPDGTDAMQHVSGGIEELWGYTKAEVLESIIPLWEQIRLGGSMDLVKSTILTAIETKSKCTCRYKIVLPNGELRTHLGNGTPIFMADGSIVFNVIILDITQEAKNEALLTQASEMSRIGSWELDLINQDGDSMYWSPMVKEILEVDGSYNPTLTGGIEFYIGESKERIQHAVTALINEGIEFDQEILLLTGKGHERWIRSIGKSETANNKRTKIYGSFQDIHERKVADIHLLNANERFEKVTEATNDAIWDWDIVNQTFYRSKAFERFFGKEDAGLFTESHMWSRDYFHPEDCANIKSSFYEAIANPLISRWELEYRVINELGDTLYVIDRAAIYRNNEGKAIRMVGAMTDISEQKQMTLQLSELNQSLQKYSLELERSNEELEQFAFVASHDLQEPLRMVSSFMDLLQRRYGDRLDEKGHQYIHFATDGAKRMKQIILDLLDFSRANKPTEGKAVIDMNEVVSEYKLLRKILISEKSATIKSNNLPILNTYKAAITQILHCLLDNALKYSAAGIPPIIKIKAVDNEHEWEFSIKDNGIGINPQFFKKIFIIFQRLHNKEEYAGTGIGLSIAKRHVEFLGGRIWLESAPGEGTVFYFTIPINK